MAKKKLTVRQLIEWKRRSEVAALSAGKANHLTKISKGFVLARKHAVKEIPAKTEAISAAKKSKDNT